MKINQDLCDVCGTCVAVGPVDAIVVSEFFVKIDEQKCIHCGNCIAICPIKAISEEQA